MPSSASSIYKKWCTFMIAWFAMGIDLQSSGSNAFQPSTSCSTRTNARVANTQLQMEFNIPTTIGAFVVSAAGVLYITGAGDRDKQRQYAEYEAEEKRIQDERARKAYIEPKPFWTEEELKDFDGTKDPDGPILIAAEGKVFNVYKVRSRL